MGADIVHNARKDHKVTCAGLLTVKAVSAILYVFQRPQAFPQGI
ncbi:MAG: hypothetical protein RL681_630 [Candidatus Parcubacteria bacterium]|jgi:hypothetical protein